MGVQPWAWEKGDEITFEHNGKICEKMIFEGVDTIAAAIIASAPSSPGKLIAYSLKNLTPLTLLNTSRFFYPVPTPNQSIIIYEFINFK
ncbi:hypothetical protein [Pseudomonas glycinae]|uniref:hypothetical protein n=1 Tax=Pseudomonas glycinae TaxID=1785145 RepID=UPI001F1CF791|nr:hypothetical protein [Pseudomonas glycinae]